MSNTMPPPPPRISLTLIVAATTKLGIGHAGGLPWPSLKSEMAYFRRVTKGLSSSTARNAVIMGRKTWDSIPAKFRPLEGRTNVVVSRSGKIQGMENGKEQDGDVIVAKSLEHAVEILGGCDKSVTAGTKSEAADSESLPPLGKVFVIGGSTVYASALKMPQTKRVLLTKIYKDYECDTFFPVDLEGEQGRKEGWVRKTWEDLEKSVEVDVKEEKVKEGDVEFEFCLLERP